MNVRECVEVVRKCEGELAKLVEEQVSLAEKKNGLSEERSKAIRDLARGNDGKRKEILRLEGEIGPLSLRLEGLQGLILEAEEAVTTARGELKVVQKSESEARELFCKQKEAEQLECVKSSMPALLQEFFDRYVELGLKASEIDVAYASFHKIPAEAKAEIEQAVERLPFTLQSALETRGVRPMMSRIAPRIGLMALVPLDQLPPDLRGYDALYPEKVANLRREERRGQWASKFDEGKI
jgi:hypothetical protein